MPKGKKICVSCGKEHGARKHKCECGHDFMAKTLMDDISPAKQGSTVRQNKSPLGLHYIPSPGLWVFDLEKGMPKVHAPEELPKGPMTKQEIYDQCAYYGLGDSVMETIPARKIADPKLRKKWKKAHEALLEAWRYLINGQEQTPKAERVGTLSVDTTTNDSSQSES